MLTDIHIARFRGGGRPARHSCTTRCQRVAEAVFVLDSAFAFVRVEHVERVVARGLLDDEHEAGSLNVNLRRARGVVGKLQLDRPHAILVERECLRAPAGLVPRGRLKPRTLRRRERDR